MSRQSNPARFPPRGTQTAGQRPSPPSSFLFSVGRALGVAVVTVHGMLDASGCAQLEQVLKDLIDNQGNLRVVVDLRDLLRVDPAGLAVFRGAAASASSRGGDLVFADPCDAVRRALDAAGLAPAVSVTGRCTPLRRRCVPSPGKPTPAERWSVTAHAAGGSGYLADQRDEP